MARSTKLSAREGTSIDVTTAAVEKIENWLHEQPEAEIVTSYVGQGAPRFFFSLSPELPDPAFAKIVVLTPDAEAREALKHRLREAVAQGLAPRPDCSGQSQCRTSPSLVPSR